MIQSNKNNLKGEALKIHIFIIDFYLLKDIGC